MLKKYKVFFIISCLITILPILPGLIFWNRLPDSIATHFSFSGEPNGYSSKMFAVVGLYMLLLAVHCVCAVLTSSDPKSKNLSGKVYCLILCICPLVSLFCAVTVYGSALGFSGTNKPGVIFVLMGLLYIVIGNYLPKCRQNFTVGLRLPWTLASTENWDRTHRFSGKIWIIGGLLLLIGAFISVLQTLWFFSGITAILVCVPCIYSFSLYKHGV